MSDKRFICGLGFPINSDEPIRIISDSVEDKDYYKFSDICNVLNEQQDTISQLQDICGESDCENAKLRIENKRLQAKNEQLREILHNCKFNKNIIREQLKLWQDTLAKYNIYTIKDLSDSFELDTKISKEKDDL